jgi:hypothetical protein
MQGTASVTLSRGVARIAVPTAALGALPPVLGGSPDVGGVRLTRVWEVLPAERWLDLAPSVALDALSRRVRDAFDQDRVRNRGLMGSEA